MKPVAVIMNLREHSRIGGALLFTLVLAALCALVTGASAASINVGTYQIDTIGDTVTAPIVLSEATTGLSGYQFTVSLGNPPVAEITSVELPSFSFLGGVNDISNSEDPPDPNWNGQVYTLPIANDTVSIKGSDLAKMVALGAKNVTLATVTIRGTAVGVSSIVVTPDTALGIQNRTGGMYSVTTPPGTVTVGTPVAAPTAAFSANVTSGIAPLNVGFTDESIGSGLTWSWTFGDGGTSNLQHPAHTYAAAGTYTVNLTVTNAGGSDDELKTGYITVTAPPIVTNPPTAAFSANVTSGVAPLAVKFTDASTGTGITAWSWTFGDGSKSTEQSPVHTYAAAGTYTVNLTVTNAGGSDDELKTGYITVTAPPIVTNPPTAAFSANVTSGVAPLAVKFTDASTGTGITAWSWTFGDGSKSTEQSPAHTYAAAGTYTVNLTVTNAGGSDDELKTGYITVTAPPIVTNPPTAAFSANVTSGVAPLAVKFTDASTGTGITAWSWTFGDGSKSTEQSPVHTYAAAGTYTVNLTVTNASGSDDELKTGYITVTAAPTNETTGPYPAPHVPTARIEAEDFDTGSQGVAYSDLEPANLGNSNHRPGEGVDIETAGGVTNVAYIRAGEYLKYSVDTTATGTFTLTLRAANPDTNAKAVKVYVDGIPAGQVSIGGTGSWTSFKDFTGATPLNIPTGRHVVTLAFEGINRINLDWLSLSASTPTPVTLLKTTPYGPGNNIPGRVQAENFDQSGADAAYSDTTSLNEGGAYRQSEPVDIEYTAGIQSYNIGWIRTGEYLVYTVQVTRDGQYKASFNAANPDTANKGIDVYVDGTKVGTAQIGATGSFGTFKNFDFTMTLLAGKHQIKLAFPSQRLNLNYVEFSNQGTVVTTTPTPTPPVSGSANFVAVPTTARHGSAFKFTVTPAPGKTIKAAWWSFDAPGHLNTWNSRTVNPTFYYYQAGTYSPLVKLTYTDGTTEEVHRVNYIRST